MTPVYVDKFLIKRRQGRVYEVLALDTLGRVLCAIPCTGIGFQQNANNRAEGTFKVDGQRFVISDDPAPAEQPTEPLQIVPRPAGVGG